MRWYRPLTLAALTLGSAACSDGTAPQEEPEPLPDLTIVAASPTSLTGEVGTALSLSVQVQTLDGMPFQGGPVQWSAASGSGTITSASSTTSDATGHASAVWVLGTTAGSQQATASVGSGAAAMSVDFMADALAGVAALASVVADSILLSARGETAFLGPTYQDQYGNPTAPGGLTWESRDESVATASPGGLITGIGDGSTYVVGSIGEPVDSILVTVSLRGAITVTFDDGFRTTYDNAWPLFQEFGLPGNIGVNPGQVGFGVGFEDYMTKAQLDELHAAGWSMVSHTMTHDSMPSLTVGELDYELRASQEWIDAQGYNGSNVFVVPFHVWGARERDAIGGYYEVTRGTSANEVSPDSLVAWRPSNPYDLTGIEGDDLPYTTTEGRDRLRALLQRTVDEGAFLDLFFHRLPPENVDAFRETLLVVDEFRERVLPYHELYPRFARSVF